MLAVQAEPPEVCFTAPLLQRSHYRQVNMPPLATGEAHRLLREYCGDDASLALLGRNIIETHIWAVREGLRGASAYDLFDGYCQRLVIHGVPLWRAHAAMETLHPQWSGYGYTWRRDLNDFAPRLFR